MISLFRHLLSFTLTLLTVISSSPVQPQNTKIDSFNDAKKILLHQVFHDHHKTAGV